MMFDLWPQPRLFIDAVRDASDLEALVAIHAEGFRRGWSVDEFERLLADPTVFCLLLRRESVWGVRRIAGFVMIRVVADQAEVLTVAVAASRRGRGHGRRLMEEALRRLYSEHVPELFLEVDEKNAAAVALYRRLGFVQVGRRKGYYRDEAGEPSAALVMRLQLR